MIYLFDKDERLIKLVKKDAIKSALQKFTLTTDRYVSDRLTVEMLDLTAQELEQVEYMAIQSIDDAHKFHFFYIAQKFSEKLTTLIGVQSGIEELRKSVVLDKRPQNTFARPVINDLLSGTNWQARFVSETSQRSTNFYYISTFEALKKVCQVWNLEMQFFVEMNGNKIGARYIDFKQKIGEATGKRVVYGHNALQILQEVERTNLFTALIGRGKGEEVSAPTSEGGHAGYGRRVTFEDIVWEKAKGAPVDKPKGQKYVELPEMTKKYGIKNADGTMRAKVGFAVFEQEEDANILIRRTYEQLVNAARPQLTLKTSTVYLKNVNIGDTIRVVRHDKKLDYDTRIFEITFNRLNNESSDIKLGDRISESNEAKIQNIASQKADELISNNFNSLLKNLPDFLPTPNGLNRNWYGASDPTKAHVGKVGINDIWFKPNPEHEGQTIMLRWTGEVWEEVIRSNTDQEIIDEISKRFENLNLSGVDEAKAKAEEALKKAGASAELVEQVKGLVDTTSENLDEFRTQAYNNFITENLFYGGLSSTKTELKKYVKEETDEKISAIRETLSSDYVAKSTFTENVEGTKQRFEALARENETKLAEYKQGIDGRFTSLLQSVDGKVNQVDFQRVKETAQLYERILGSSESDISRNASRLVMSDQVFQTEVGKYVTDDNNLIVNSLTMNKHTLTGNNNPNVEISVNDGIFAIKAQGLTGYNWSGFSLPIYVKKIYHGETYTLGFKYRIIEYPDSSFAFNIKNHGLNKTLTWANIGENRPPLNEWQEFQKTFTVQEDFAFGEDKNYPFYIYLAKNGWIEFKEPILVRGSKTGTYKPSQFDDAYKITDEAKGLATDAQTRAIQIAQGLEATRTQVTQLSNSWAVKALNSAGDILGQLNLNKDGSVRINDALVAVGEKTYIQDGVIKKSMIGNAQIGTAHIGEIDASQANIINISAKNIVADGLTANIIKGGVLSALNGNSNFDLNAGRITMQSGPTSWKTSWDPNGIAFRGPNNDVWGAMGGNSGGGVGIYMRGNHAFNLVANHSDSGKSNSYTPLRFKYGEGTTLQFSPGGPTYNLLLLFNDIYQNLILLHKHKETRTGYSNSLIGPLK
jgi:phage minor structural protein, N-terminal domain protein|uniref:Minor structural protein n=1 Tax=Siphoviridae sp. ctOow3 TaxID=2826315 RepID=A0A8S5QZ56_9CAUD|nr:MAG TPA: minor structural protein [Siphoviridae sp. ctOow3]